MVLYLYKIYSKFTQFYSNFALIFRFFRQLFEFVFNPAYKYDGGGRNV